VVSVGSYASTPTKARFSKGLEALEREDEPTLIVLTDAACLLTANAKDYYDLCGEALMQCNKLGDRFAIVDVLSSDSQVSFRSGLVSDYLMYGAAYYPYLQTSIPYRYEETGVKLPSSGSANGKLTASLNLGGANGIKVSFAGASGSKPTVVVNVGTKSDSPSFAVAGSELTIGNATDQTGTAVVKAWNDWKKTGKPGGFDIAVAGDGSAKIADNDVPSKPLEVTGATGSSDTLTLASLKSTNTAVYNRARAALDEQYITLPPSAAVAGIYARVDRDQGVWKSPANASVMAVLGAAKKITDQEQESLNIDPVAGKSINAIRDFTGKGTLVWGARTLAGNDNEWRYVSVRRLFITIEESSKKASAFAVFEPNDQSTWLKVKAMIESYLYGLWEQGALAGSKPEAAYYVHVGLGTTMTPQDVLEGRMIVEIGIAAVRPAEFIVLKFSHKMQSA
jgi:hypothetical protein